MHACTEARTVVQLVEEQTVLRRDQAPLEPLLAFEG